MAVMMNDVGDDDEVVVEEVEVTDSEEEEEQEEIEYAVNCGNPVTTTTIKIAPTAPFHSVLDTITGNNSVLNYQFN